MQVKGILMSTSFIVASSHFQLAPVGPQVRFPLGAFRSAIVYRAGRAPLHLLFLQGESAPQCFKQGRGVAALLS